jgi:GTP pyrophosphokinase
VRVRGVGNLLTTVANCCQPVPWDDIVGFITRGKGVTIHRADCANMINLGEAEMARLIEVDWGTDQAQQNRHYSVKILIQAYDRQGLLRDVSTVLANQNIDVLAINTLSDTEEQTADMHLTVQVANMGELTTLMDRVRQLRNVSAVEREI